MGCGNSKPKPQGWHPKAEPVGREANDLVEEDMGAGAAADAKTGASTGIVAQAQQPGGGSLLSSWNTPTANAAHARIIRTATTTDGAETSPETGKPKMRGRPAIRDNNAVKENDGDDSSDDEEEKADASVGMPAQALPPGAVERSGVLTMFRPRTPHAVMDLD